MFYVFYPYNSIIFIYYIYNFCLNFALFDSVQDINFIVWRILDYISGE